MNSKKIPKLKENSKKVLRSCKVCKSSFSSNAALTKHREVHHSTFLVRFKCIYCDHDPYGNPGNLRSHYISAHNLVTCESYMRILFINDYKNRFNYFDRMLSKNLCEIVMILLLFTFLF